MQHRLVPELARNKLVFPRFECRRETNRVRPLHVFWLAQAVCFFIAAISLPGCQRRVEALPSVSVRTEIAPQPVAVGVATVTVKLSDARNSSISGAKVTVEGDMSHPGMSPVFADAQELPDGRYQAKLQLGMAGDWVVILHIGLPGGQTLERQIDLKGVRSN
jgi:hypothetical protein